MTESDSVLSFDIGIMPLQDDPFSRGKCAFKAVFCMSRGIPVVASPVGANKRLIDHGSNGWLAAGTGDWIEGISVLTEEVARRAEVGKSAPSRVEQGYSAERASNTLAHVLRAAAGDRVRPDARVELLSDDGAVSFERGAAELFKEAETEAVEFRGTERRVVRERRGKLAIVHTSLRLDMPSLPDHRGCQPNRLDRGDERLSPVAVAEHSVEPPRGGERKSRRMTGDLASREVLEREPVPVPRQKAGAKPRAPRARRPAQMVCHRPRGRTGMSSPRSWARNPQSTSSR